MYQLKCYSCGKVYDINEKIWKCNCEGYLNIESQKRISFEKSYNRYITLWKYKENIPVFDESSIVSFDEGFTPLVKENVGNKTVYLKLDYLFPSGSYKDRGSTVLVSKANELKIKHIVEDSSGNAGASIGMYAAKSGIKADIYIPASASKGKLVQLLSFKANLKLIRGSREDTSNAVLSAAEKIYYASHVWNPFFFEGTKTFAFEIFEQLNFNIPDNLVIPVGNGTLLIGAYIGFKQIMESGYSDKMPKFICVQSEHCSPLNEKISNKKCNYHETIAEGVAIKEPLRLNQMIDIINETNSEVITVSDDEIKNTLPEILSKGYYIEPTSVSVIAALKKIDLNGLTVVELTGNGLKANEKIQSLLPYCC